MFFKCMHVSSNIELGYTALIWAAKAGHVSTVQALIDAGASKDIKDEVNLLNMHLYC